MNYTTTPEQRQAFSAGAHVGILTVAASKGDRAPVQMPVWYGHQPGHDVLITTRQPIARSRSSSKLADFRRACNAPSRRTATSRLKALRGSAQTTTRRDEGASPPVISTTASPRSTWHRHKTCLWSSLRLVPQRWRATDFSSQLGRPRREAPALRTSTIHRHALLDGNYPQDEL